MKIFEEEEEEGEREGEEREELIQLKRFSFVLGKRESAKQLSPFSANKNSIFSLFQELFGREFLHVLL